MADIRKAVQDISRAGVAPTYTGSLTVADEYLVNNNGRVLLHFKKASAGVCTVTVKTPIKVAGLDVAELTFDVPASSGDVMVGPFPPTIFNHDGKDLRITFSNIAGLTFAAMRL